MIKSFILCILSILLISCASKNNIAQQEYPQSNSARQFVYISPPLVKGKSSLMNPAFPKYNIAWKELNKENILDAVMNFKIVMFYLYEDDCTLCDIFEVKVLQNKTITEQVNDRFLPIKLHKDSEEANELFEFVNETPDYPILLFLTPNNMHILTLNGYMPANIISEIMKRMINSLDNVVAPESSYMIPS